MFEIIEDCRPYYVRFSFPQIKDILAIYQRERFADDGWRFVNHKYPLSVAQEILDKASLPAALDLNPDRVRLFCSKPGFRYPAHKDGLNMRFSVNVGVEIKDALCKTNFYTDESLAHMHRDSKYPYIRQLTPFGVEYPTPVKTLVARQGEAVLLNTDIYHDWDNTESKNLRVALTLRDRNPNDDRLTFAQAYEILFGSTSVNTGAC